MQVEPQTPLPVVYQIVDHTDPNWDSYYVRAVVRDSLTNRTIQVVNVPTAGSGTGRYATSVPAPEDGSGLGRQIDITTTVYTDSGYTVKADNYQQIVEKWYVKAAPISFGYGGGNGDAIDYKRLQKLLAEELVKAFADVEKPERVDLGPVLQALESLMAGVSGIEMPEIPGFDLSPVTDHILALETSIIGAINDIPAPKETDLSPVVESVQAFGDKLHEAVSAMAHDHKEVLPELVGKHVEGVVEKALADSTKRREKTQQAMRIMLEENEPVLSAGKSDSAFSNFLNNKK